MTIITKHMLETEFLKYLNPLSGIYYISIGCAESTAWVGVKNALDQQYPDFIRIGTNFHKTIILIDENLEIPTHLESNFKEIPMDLFQLTLPNSYVIQYNNLTLITLRSNQIFNIDWEDDKYIIRPNTIEFFATILTHMWETDSCCLVHCFTGHSLFPLKRHFKGFLPKDKLIWSINQYADYSCYAPKNDLSSIAIKDILGSPHIITPYSINKDLYYDIYNSPETNRTLKFQMEYYLYAKCLPKLKLISYSIESLERKITNGELLEKYYWRNLPISCELRNTLINIYDKNKIEAVYILRQIFVSYLEKIAAIVPKNHDKLSQLNNWKVIYKKPTKIVENFIEIAESLYGIKKYKDIIIEY